MSLLASADADPPRSDANAAIVTIVMGKDYERVWECVCCASWQRYARRIGVDIIVLKARIDAADTERSPAWQKLLILGLPWAKRYERIIWLDSDIIISDQAPNILDYAGPLKKVSLCVDSGRLSPVEAQVYIERVWRRNLSPDGYMNDWPRWNREVYIKDGLSPYDIIFNTGVMVLSPEYHNGLLKKIYLCPETSSLYEQTYLSHLLLESHLAYEISPRFNWGMFEYFHVLLETLKEEEDEAFIGKFVHVITCSELRNAYFLHFNGIQGLLRHFADSPVLDKRAEAA